MTPATWPDSITAARLKDVRALLALSYRELAARLGCCPRQAIRYGVTGIYPRAVRSTPARLVQA